ncbi:MAG: ferredoxin--NADP reductase [Magnetospirillum sp. WYHS-4]
MQDLWLSGAGLNPFPRRPSRRFCAAPAVGYHPAMFEDYNATLLRRIDITPRLAILRVKPDGPVFEFAAGQYTVLGLRRNAPRLPAGGEGDDPPLGAADRLVKRAYSISSGSLERESLEFYVSLVPSGELTPRLFALKEGDRLFLGPRAKGLFTLQEVPSDRHVLMVATGTGLAPYMSMLRTRVLVASERRVAVLHGARYSWDLGYRGELEDLRRACPRFAYLPVVSRPADDPAWNGRAGRLPRWLDDPALEEACGFPLVPACTHVFLCGNPAMIEEAEPRLATRGYGPDSLHREKYW